MTGRSLSIIHAKSEGPDLLGSATGLDGIIITPPGGPALSPVYAGHASYESTLVNKTARRERKENPKQGTSCVSGSQELAVK